ncbi:MAG: nitroreductase family protein [Bacteroidota bacterium]
MQQTSVVEHPISSLLDQRWSPRAFQSDRILSDEQIHQLFEAARWSPSSYNAQPWRFFYAKNRETDAFERLLDCTYPSNQVWAKDAGMLVLSIAQLTVEVQGNTHPNSYAWYDLGAANMALSIQATEMGLYVHQIAGFDKAKARETFDLGPDQDPVVMMAIGYKGEADQLAEPLRQRELPKKPRMTQEEFVTRIVRLEK